MNLNQKISLSDFFKKIKNIITRLYLWEQTWSFPVFVKTMFLVALLVASAGYFIQKEVSSLNEKVFSQREGVATLASNLIHERLSRTIDLSASIVSQPLFNTAVVSKDISLIDEILNNIPQSFSYVDCAILLNSQGVAVTSTLSHSDPAVVGKDFSNAAYIAAARSSRASYVSGVFRESGDSGAYVVAVVTPVISNGSIAGYLILCIRLESIAVWSKSFPVGDAGTIYIVDQNGYVISNTSSSWGGGLIDYSTEEPVQMLMRGTSGVSVINSSIDRERVVAAYSPVPAYGWGVVVTQETESAFLDRDAELLLLIVPWAIIIVLVGASFYLILSRKEYLRKERDNEKMFLECIGDGVVAIDREWNITLWNHAASSITGWQEHEVLGKPLRSIVKFIKETDRTEYYSFIEDAIVSGNKTSIPHGTVLIRKDASEIPVGDSAAPVVNARGQAVGAIVIFRDSTKEVEDERMRSDLAYATHQLRTPVTEALWNLEIAINESSEEKKKEDLLVVYSSLMNIKKLTEHLVEVSGFDQGAKVVKLESINTVDLFREVRNSLAKIIEKQKTQISFSAVPSMLMIETDPKILGKALYEIFENSVLYSPEGSKVVVTASLQGKNFIVEIIDHGFGIPGMEQPIIFTKFFRGTNRGLNTAGAGLGLFIAKECVRLLGGKIWFESEEGVGTTFYVSIPMK